MATIDLKEGRNEKALESVKYGVMRWYDGKTDEAFYRDALAELIGYALYGKLGEDLKGSMNLYAWLREEGAKREEENSEE